MKLIFITFLVFATSIINAQNAIIKGVVTNKFGTPIEGVAVSYYTNGTSTDKHGKYKLTIPINKEIILSFSHISYQSFKKTIKASTNKTILFSLILKSEIEEISEVVVKDNKKDVQGIISVNPADISKIPGANQGVENILMTLAGVNNNNELSTQYNVRGGNFDENLVYVNGIEIYRPFLVRSGQQEGLSFINESMVEKINFSAGGFQAKYGDKLSSVLDISYRTPTKFATSIKASLLGASITVESLLLNNKLSAIIGLRYRDNSLFIQSKDIETTTKPNFTDGQLFLSYLINSRLKIDFLGSYSLNNYETIPKSRLTRFGTAMNPQELIVHYKGQEKDKFKTALGAIKINYIYNENLNFDASASIYHTIEEEYYDIFAIYKLGEVNLNANEDVFGETSYSNRIGSQLNHARNNLDAVINRAEFKTTYKKNRHQLDAGIKYQHENIKDRINQWEMLDSLGFAVRPPHHNPNNQPYQPYNAPIEPYIGVKAEHDVTMNRLVWFIQYSKNALVNNHKIWYNLGFRSHNWNVNDQVLPTVNHTIFSLRGQFSIKPDWEKDMLFRVSAGMYDQPPFYKELRDEEGILNPMVDAQRSVQVVIANNYSFKLWNRPFKLISEIYHKHLTKVNPYTVNNVQITYAVNNNATAYAAGVDFRLHGEFVLGTQSWVSVGFLKTEENWNQQGYIARPTDQRFKFGILFQDYIPNIPAVKMYLNLVYNTGVPGGSPPFSNPYDYQNRLRAYKRADIGVSYVIKDAANLNRHPRMFFFKEFLVGVELFNMFDVQNSITNTWVRDVYSKNHYAIPNYMTGRVFNVKLEMKF